MNSLFKPRRNGEKSKKSRTKNRGASLGDGGLETAELLENHHLPQSTSSDSGLKFVLRKIWPSFVCFFINYLGSFLVFPGVLARLPASRSSDWGDSLWFPILVLVRFILLTPF